LIGYFSKIPILPKEVGKKETLARYLTHSKWFKAEENMVKHHAFMPPPNLMFSVFRIDRLTEFEIWKIGLEKVIALLPGKPKLYGRADIKALHFLGCKLQIDPDDNPPRHANIIGWPTEKEEKKSIALELAANASLRLRNG
jgi:hypothetical protein